MAGEIIDFVNNAVDGGTSGTTTQGCLNNILPSSAYAATTQGAVVDLSNGEMMTHGVVIGNAFGGSCTSVTVQLEECSTTNGTFTVITGPQGKALCTLTASTQYFAFSGLRTQRYARLNAITCVATTISYGLVGLIISQRKFSAGGSSDKGGYSRAPSS